MPTLELEMPDYAKATKEQRASYISSSIRWLQLKKYQYEVTFSLYMLTPLEKFIFNLILFVLVSLLVTAASLYLPNHVALIYNRIWYYVHGEFAFITASADKATIVANGISATSDLLESVGPTVKTTLKEL